MRPDETPGKSTPKDIVTDSATPIPGSAHRVGQGKKVLKHHSLIDKVYRWENLWMAWRKVRRNKGAHGLDRVTIKAFETDAEMHLRELQRKLMQNRKGEITGVTVFGPDGYEDVGAKAVVLACGGFEADPEMRVRYYGPGWEMARVRGTRHNTGDGIKAALEIGAAAFGGWSTCHAVQWDLSAPPFGDRVVLDNYQKHSYPIGIMVNVDGERFVDEGADYRNYTYAKYGREVMKQPQRMAVQIFDNKTNHMTRDEYRIRQVTKAEANTLEELAQKLEISPAGLVHTVKEFNAACQPGEYNPAILDGKHTKGITPPKSNWALPIDEPPFHGYAVTCGITFSFGGLKITTDGEVEDTTGRVIPGLFAGGELVGGIFYQNYLGGAGLMSGSVFGRIAGRSAGKYGAR